MLSKPIVFLGPTLRIAQPDSLEFRPPVRRGDLARIADTPVRAVLIVDGAFLHLAPAVHREYLLLLRRGFRVYGCSSMGALRAVELRGHGMLGYGKVYEALLTDIICDDSELGVAYYPSSNEPLTVPLVNVRVILGLACSKGVPTRLAEKLFRTAQSIYFLERTRTRLLFAWQNEAAEHFALLRQIAFSPESDVKARDVSGAIDLLSGRTLRPGSSLIEKVPFFANGVIVLV